MTTIERLEKWKSEHKSRSVSIEIDNGFGACCWIVQLTGRKLAADPNRGPDGEVDVMADRAGWFRKHRTTVTAYESCGVDEDEVQVKEDGPLIVFAYKPDGWGGLDLTINAAIDRWEKLEQMQPAEAARA